MLNIGPQELLLILVVALVVVGPQRLPELSRSIGKALRSLRAAQDEVRKTVNEVLEPQVVGEATQEFRKAKAEIRDALRPEAAATRPTAPPGSPSTATSEAAAASSDVEEERRSATGSGPETGT